MSRPLTIIGGGLAGLTLGLGLRRAGIPVTVWESGGYPRHKVCGEFISGRGQDVLARLGLLGHLADAGAVPARTAAFTFCKASSPPRPLPVPALSVSRLALDALLARQFQECGGELLENSRWTDSCLREGVVRASGRRARASQGGWRWFGLKVHARNVPLVADLEMHALGHAYVGLTRLCEGKVNVCGLFRRPIHNPAHSGPAAGLEMLRGGVGAALHRRLEHARLDEDSFCSVAGLCLRAERALERAECALGDALTMIPPVTGNGMSMAFEAAELAVEPLAAWSQGRLSWERARERIARDCDRAFARRLAWARWLQWMMFAPAFQTRLGALPLRSDWLWRTMFAHTR